MRFKENHSSEKRDCRLADALPKVFESFPDDNRRVVGRVFRNLKRALLHHEGGTIALRHGVQREGADQKYSLEHVCNPYHFYDALREAGVPLKLRDLADYERHAYRPLVAGQISIKRFFKIVQSSVGRPGVGISYTSSSPHGFVGMQQVPGVH